MDELEDGISQVPQEVVYIPAELFADDVLLLANSTDGLQALLELESAWKKAAKWSETQRPEKLKL